MRWRALQSLFWAGITLLLMITVADAEGDRATRPSEFLLLAQSEAFGAAVGLAGVFEDRQLGWGREVAIGQDVRQRRAPSPSSEDGASGTDPCRRITKGMGSNQFISQACSI